MTHYFIAANAWLAVGLTLLIGQWGVVVGYAALMTDAYPPFRLDMGGREPTPDSAAADAIAPDPAPGLS